MQVNGPNGPDFQAVAKCVIVPARGPTGENDDDEDESERRLYRNVPQDFQAA